MGKSQYPRRGHRLAPATLRELLQIPLAAKYCGTDADTGLSLCDLDETAWDRFSQQTCQELAGEIIRVLGRIARLPRHIGERPLPALPPTVAMADLDLEIRTRNCLIAAGLHQRSQDLREMTIEGILGLRGFWVKCLVDLLTSMEFAADHPGAYKQLHNRPEPMAAVSRRTYRYPRPGFRIAPAALAAILEEPLPPPLVAGTSLEGKRLCDLGEEVWTALDAKRISRLAELVVARVNARAQCRSIQRRRMPRLPQGLRLDDLQLENRTLGCLRRAGFSNRPEDLGKQTVGDLLSIRAFGAKCLVDLLSSLETLAGRQGTLDEALTAEAAALAAMPEATDVYFSDPRLGGLLREIDNRAGTVAEAASQIVKRRADPPDPLRLCEQLAEIRRRMTHCTHLRLEEELTEIFSPPDRGRDARIVAEYYGWDGGGGHTLEELGRKYALSRERIRQVCLQAVQRIRGAKVFAPVLDRALEFLRQRLPIDAGGLRAEFDAAGFSARRLPLETVGEAARLLQCPHQFAIVALGDRGLAVRPEDRRLPRAAIQIARRAVLSYGAATIAHVASEMSSEFGKFDEAVVRESLKTLPDFHWLDESRGWFQLDCLPQYGLPHIIGKVLSVAPRIEISRLRAAIARHRRAAKSLPPAAALLEFCRRMPGVRVQARTVIAERENDWEEVLAGVEAQIVRVLRTHGPLMDRATLEEWCVRDGMNRFSFNAVVMSSPVIAQYGRGVYGLIGIRVDRKTVQSLSAGKAGQSAARVLHGFGHTAGGQIYLKYRLSKAAILGGVIAVPATLKEQVRGQFVIRTPDGRSAGTLVAKDGCAWGLGPALRNHDARPGDHLLVLFDPEEQEAIIQIGEEDSLEWLDAGKQSVT